MRYALATALAFAGTAHAMSMSSSTDIGDPMSREGSGTSWLPDSSPIHAYMQMLGDDMLMLHGTMFPRYTHVGGDRDVSASGDGSNAKVDAPSMLMAMYSHALDEGNQLGARVMLSLDPIIDRAYGYPLLYQSGESYDGAPLHDRQHPHDLVDEISVSYSGRTAASQSISVYLGYPGEPALGPPVFMHRISGMDGPDAPVGHHWQDATHIAFGVATLGYSFGTWKVEGSLFTGREPDENRYGFDRARFDSSSARLSWNPHRDLALQASYGFLKAPETHEPGVDVHRITASALFNQALAEDRNLATAFVCGQNRARGAATNAFLMEANYDHAPNTYYGRIERVEKSGGELALAESREDEVFAVMSYAIGYVRDVIRDRGVDVGVGAQITVGTNPESLAEIYGGRVHAGYQAFLRLRPSRL